MGKRERIAQVRIRGGRMRCTSCGGLVAEVVLFEPGRPICVRCADEQHPRVERLRQAASRPEPDTDRVDGARPMPGGAV